jgi:hypothetical protein
VNPRSRTSVVVLITLAELAWLSCFALLFAYRGKVGELGKLRKEHTLTSARLAKWEEKLPDSAKLFQELQLAKDQYGSLQADFAILRQRFGKISSVEIVRGFDKLENKLSTEESERAKLQKALQDKIRTEESIRIELASALAEKLHLESLLKSLPTNTVEIALQLQVLTNTLADARQSLDQARAEQAKYKDEAQNSTVVLGKTKNDLRKAEQRLAALPADFDRFVEQYQLTSNQLAQSRLEKLHVLEEAQNRERGEFSVRRELTGLPSGNLKKVVFLVDTSTSMRNSPAWTSARQLIRTWLEFLPVEECALVNFNDDAVGFPKEGFHRVRHSDGTELRQMREQLLGVFDKATPGTFTDLLRGLRKAYSYPEANVIVLFTDGHPHVHYRRDAALAAEIFEEVKKHTKTPVLTVALGSYEIEGADGPRARTNAPIAFLKELARKTGGNFLAR